MTNLISYEYNIYPASSSLTPSQLDGYIID
jgi:hypothetical protein